MDKLIAWHNSRGYAINFCDSVTLNSRGYGIMVDFFKTHACMFPKKKVLFYRRMRISPPKKDMFLDSAQWAASIGALFSSPRGRETSQPKFTLPAWPKIKSVTLDSSYDGIKSVTLNSGKIKSETLDSSYDGISVENYFPAKVDKLIAWQIDPRRFDITTDVTL